MNKNLILILSILLIVSCTKTNVTKVNKSNQPTKGDLFYALPMVKLLLKVNIKETTVFPADDAYGSYTEQFLDLVANTQPKHKKYSYVSSEVESIVEADTENIYSVSIGRNFFKKITFDMNTGLKGELGDTELKIEDQTIPLITTIIDASTSLINKEALDKSYAIDSNTDSLVFNHETTIDDISNYFVKRDLKTILSIRDARFNIISGDKTSDASTRKFMLDELEKEEKKLLKKFVGYKEETTKSYYFLINPLKL